jgi:glyoxylase-like metal-dependent hydrolase (beta-lactamase superfamily II)
MAEIAGAGRTKIGRGRHAVTLEPVAEGVWLVRGGFPKRAMNAFFIEDDDGVTMFDAAISDMARGLQEAAERFGGIKRIVLGHAHEDHRGAAPEIGAPVWCHEAERTYAESDLEPMTGYFDISKLEKRLPRMLYPRLLSQWDGGPVKVAGTLSEGDDVAGFRVVHVPGHAPGQIALFRESDRLALTTDTFYVLDPQDLLIRLRPPAPAHRAFNFDTEQARESIRKLAELEPASAWPGHLNPLVGDVRAQLQSAADTP